MRSAVNSQSSTTYITESLTLEANQFMNRQIMYDDLVLGEIQRVPNSTKLMFIKDQHIDISWLPFEIQSWYNCPEGTDLTPFLKVFMDERVIPPNRLGIRKILKQAGLKKYDTYALGDKLRYSNHQPWWIAIEDTDSYSKTSLRGQLGVLPWTLQLGIPDSDREKYRWRP